MSHCNRYHRPTPTPLSNRRTKPSSSILGTASSVATTAATASTLILAAQAAHVAWKTPRLPPPPNSGYNFPMNGLVTVNDGTVSIEAGEEDGEILNVEKLPMMLNATNDDDDHDDESSEEENNHQEEKKTEKAPKIINHDIFSNNHRSEEEFNLVLLGDSPVEGIGNKTHSTSLSGQTAKAFSKICCNSQKVRYWSFGLSGLTARGVEDHMLRLLHRLTTEGSNSRRKMKKKINAVVLSCGVNNVLWGQPAASFGHELKSLVKAVRSSPGCEDAVIVVLGLPDFSRMPFLPWPFCSVVGWRGRALSEEMDKVIKELKEEKEEGGISRGRIVLAKVPEVEDVFRDVKNDDCLTNQNEEHIEKTRPVHVLLDHLRHDSKVLSSLEIKDFFADDGFHPGKHGTILLGNLLARVYAEEMGIPIR